jgi:ArsR family transcriptional regulator
MKSKRSEAEFESTFTAYSEIAKALAHPARVAILKLLQENNYQSCQNIVDQLPYTQSTVSQHLYKLVSAGLLESKGVKTSTIYSINSAALHKFNSMFFEVFVQKKDDRQLSLF